jgi:hypothetical protein
VALIDRVYDPESWTILAVEEIIFSNLVGNKHLKELTIMNCPHLDGVFFSIEKLLCDISSIERISNSNHTLESILLGGYMFSFSTTFPKKMPRAQ